MSTSTDKPGLGDEIYSGAASFGVFWALLGAIMATIIGTLLIGFGIYLMVHKTNRKTVSAKVVYINGIPDGTCQKTQDNPPQYNCAVTVKYDGWKDPIQISYTGPDSYYVGETIDIYVDNNNPGDATLDKPVPKWMGLIIIAVALIMIGGAWFWYWASRRWKFIAAAEGASGAISLISGGRW